jgi:hypothetical protein
MKKFLTSSLGGIPFVWDDWRFQNDFYLETMEAFCQAFAQSVDANSFILEGCVLNQGAGTLSAGLVYIGGELQIVEAVTGLATPLSSEAWYWELGSASYDAAGIKTLEDGITIVSTYQKKVAGLAIYTIGSEPVGAHRYDINEALRGRWVSPTSPYGSYTEEISPNPLGYANPWGLQWKYDAVLKELTVRGLYSVTGGSSFGSEHIYLNNRFLLQSFRESPASGIAYQPAFYSPSGANTGIMNAAINVAVGASDLAVFALSLGTINLGGAEVCVLNGRKLDGTVLPVGSTVILNHKFYL